ncbi:MAG: OmcA/MtrC family decaheme c-type cytochrome [Burkholderiaceae bacterium]
MNSYSVRTKLATQWALAALAAVALAGCGSGDTGPAGPAGPAGANATNAVVVAGNTAPATDAAAAAWAALTPAVTVTSVTISSPPVVNFAVKDGAGNPVVGLGSTSQSATATEKGLTNLAFALAKLVPGTNGSPSKWVSYIVTTVPTYKKPQPDPGNDTTTNPAAPARPGTDNTGKLVDNGDGSYRYTFFRDIPQIATQVAAMTVTGANVKADLGNLAYEPSLVHRLTIQVSGNAPGTGTNTPNGAEVAGFPGVPMVKPLDVIYDFIPATGQAVADSGRDIVATAKCNECHRQLGGVPGDSPESSGAGFHGGSRNETRYCVVCHTDQRKYGRTEVASAIDTTTTPNTIAFPAGSSTYVVDGRTVGNLPNHIHKTHMGKHLVKRNYNYGGLVYNEVLFPQDLRNCTKCHDGSDSSTAKTKQGDNWKNAPSRLACGACHDGINFATGAGVTLADAAKGLTSTTSQTNGLAHGGLAQADDTQCAQCHTSGNIDVVHLAVTPPNTQSALHVAGGSANVNSAWIASNTSRLPAGAIKVSNDIKSVSRNASKQPVMVFRMLQDGARKDLNVFASAAVDPATGSKEIWDGFMGSPSAYFVFSVPQDGITAPVDFNSTASGYLKNIWNGSATGTSAGTLTGPDADGYYTVTLTGVTVPDSAVMLTGGLGYSYNVSSTLPLTQTNLPSYPVAASPAGNANEIGGLIVIVPNAQKIATGYNGRRAIVEDARCNKCHQELGTFTEEAFHGGQRNDGSTCAWCHTPNRTSAGWSADSTSYIHAIHAGNKRTQEFTWHASSVDEGFFDIKFPGVLRQCETCHLPGTYDFSSINNATNSAGAVVAANSSANALPNRPYRTVGQGTYASASSTAFTFAPYVTQDFSYGLGFSFNAGTGVITDAAATTLVNSPITTACFACHDSTLARAHMEVNGGSIYAPRSTALAKIETCMVCHASGRIADIKAMHAK